MSQDISKLPKWAQSRIEVLENDLAYYKKKYEAALAAQDLAADEHYAIMPKGEKAVRFPIGDRYDEAFEVRLVGRGLDVRGGSGILIHPRAGNSVEVWLEER